MSTRFYATVLLLASLGCQCEDDHRQGSPSSSVAPQLSQGDESSVPVSNGEWGALIDQLRQALKRKVPQAMGGRIVGVRYLPGPHNPGARIGLPHGSYIVEVNGNGAWHDAGELIDAELERSAGSCRVSFTIEEDGTRRIAAAHCAAGPRPAQGWRSL